MLLFDSTPGLICVAYSAGAHRVVCVLCVQSQEGSVSQSATKTTLDDLMATLSKLEEGASFDKRNDDRSKNEKPLAWRKIV